MKSYTERARRREKKKETKKMAPVGLEAVHFMATTIIPQERLKEKQLKKLMGDDYHTKPAMRYMLSKLEGVMAVADMDGGRPVEWKDLETERERKICMVHFWKGVEQGRQWVKEGMLE